jgi:hypothetical protein
MITGVSRANSQRNSIVAHDPYQVAHWIAEGVDHGDSRELRQVIEQAIRNRGEALSADELADAAEAMEPHVHYQLGVVSDEMVRDGIEPTYIVEGEPGSAYLRGVHLATSAALQRMKVLKSKEFERLCAEILVRMGAVGKDVGGTDDDAVDFFAKDVPLGGPRIAALKVCRVLLVGQAKRYTTKPVNMNHVRTFVGGTIVRVDKLRREDDRLGVAGPVILAYWTTGVFNRTAEEYGRRAGVWMLSGMALAQLCNSLDIDLGTFEAEVPAAIQ